jgi:hypothetical protein
MLKMGNTIKMGFTKMNNKITRMRSRISRRSIIRRKRRIR